MSKTGVNSENNKKSDGNGLFRRFAGITMVGLATVTGGQAKTLADNVNDKEDVKTEYVSDNVSTPDDVKTYKFEASSSLAKDQSDKYMTNITVRNDSVAMVNGVQALYHPEKGDIRIRKGDFSYEDFGFKNAPDGKIEELLIIHEAEHEIDIEQKGVGTEKVSLNEFYQRDYHLEVGALIAEKLEIRRQFVKAQTDEEKKAFFEKFGKDVENKEYVNALRIGRFNPNSGNSQDFMKEMAFIKDSSIRFRCDPNDHSYHENTVENAMLYLAREGNNVKSNPSGFEKEVKAIYQIGGFDFSKVGNQDLYLMKGNSLDVADKLLESGADASKVIKFMNEGKEGFAVSNDAFAWAESFDVSGLSREQAETLLQTAIVAKESANNVAESICLGKEDKYEFSALGGKEQTALYLDMKRDIWEKNGTLSEAGDEEKFNRLMKEAKTVEVDCEGWLESVKGILLVAKDPSRKAEFEEIKRRAKENQGKVVNVDDYSTGLELPLEGKSVDVVLDDMRKKEEEDRKFWEEYYKQNPKEKEAKERLSEPYQMKIMDLQSSILADELERKKEEENKVENLRDSSRIETYAPLGDGMLIKVETPKFDKAELRKITNKDGQSIEVAMLDGQKHGAEIVRDADGTVIDFKLYDHGKEIDTTNRNVNIRTNKKDGMSYTAVELDGVKFGAEIVTYANGKTKASFYDNAGLLMEGSNISKSYVEGEFYSKAQLREEIKEQEGELYENPKAKAQEMRFGFRVDARHQDSQSKVEEGNLVQQKATTKNGYTPVWSAENMCIR